MKPTHARRQGESSQGWGLSGGGPVVSLRGQGRGLGGSAGQVCTRRPHRGGWSGLVAGGRAWGCRGTNSIARRSTPCQAASVRGQSNQVLSEVLRAGRASTAGLSPLSTPDSILMCYVTQTDGFRRGWGGQHGVGRGALSDRSRPLSDVLKHARLASTGEERGTEAL